MDERIGPYRVCSELASGGMGEVLLACDDRLAGAGRFVAVKRLRPEHRKHSEFSQMFVDEARIAAKINHPNVCRVVDFDAHAEPPYLVMELVGGETLCKVDQALRRATDAFPPAKRASLVARLVADACEGIHAAHELRDEDGSALGLVHRDVSLDNLLLSFDGVVKVIDFGVVRAERREHRTQTGHVKGKLAYLAPELLLGQKADRRADVWGLGVVLWEMLAQTRLFRQGSDLETLRRVAAAPILSPSTACSGLPKELDAIVLKALSRDRAGRYETARELGKALHQYLAQRREAIGVAELAEMMETLFPGARRRHERLLSTIAPPTEATPPRRAHGVAFENSANEPPPRESQHSSPTATRLVPRGRARSRVRTEPVPIATLPPPSLPPPHLGRSSGVLRFAAIGAAVVAFLITGAVAYARRPAGQVEPPPPAAPPTPELTAGRYVLEVVDGDSGTPRVLRILSTAQDPAPLAPVQTVPPPASSGSTTQTVNRR